MPKRSKAQLCSRNMEGSAQKSLWAPSIPATHCVTLARDIQQVSCLYCAVRSKADAVKGMFARSHHSNNEPHRVLGSVLRRHHKGLPMLWEQHFAPQVVAMIRDIGDIHRLQRICFRSCVLRRVHLLIPPSLCLCTQPYPLLSMCVYQH